MNQDLQFTVKFHHDRYISIRNNLGYEIYELTDNLNLNRLNDTDFLKKSYQQNEKVKMVEPLYLFQKDLIAVIKQGKGDILELINTNEEMVIYTSNRFPTPVLSLGSTRDKLLICIEGSIYLYSLTNDRCSSDECKLYIHSFEARVDTPYAVTTSSNPNGIFALGNIYYAVPDNSKSGIIKLYTLSNKYSTHTIRAHSEAVSAIAFDSSENLIATAPESGTVILVYHRCTRNGQPLFTFKRGYSYASISCLSFNKEFRYLACSSDKTTIHIFLCSLEEKKMGWWDYISTSSKRAYFTAKLPKCDMKSSLILKSLSPIKLLVVTNEGSLKLYSSVESNARGIELTLVKEQMLDLAMSNKNNINLE